MKITLGTFVLADSPDPIPMTNLRINGARAVQEAKFFRAVAEAFYDRGNRKTEISFDVTRKFDDQLSAESFMIYHETQLPGSGLLTLVTQNPGNATQSGYGLNAVLQSVSSSQTGCTTKHSYRISFGVMQTTAS